jgi:prepilin-type N-terminal cleavage/methylation domain-containing protein
MKIQSRQKAGFTLVEIMIVVAIIGLLAAIGTTPSVACSQSTLTSNAHVMP